MKMIRARTRRGEARGVVLSVAGALAASAWLVTTNADAQFSPYKPDTNTVALYHFNVFKNGTDVTQSATGVVTNVPLSGTLRLGHSASSLDAWWDEIRISNTIRSFKPFDPAASPVPEPAAISSEH